MALRIVLGILLIAAGMLHYVIPKTYAAIVPPYLPAHLILVYVSGLFEILGGVCLLLPENLDGFHVRRFGAWGLVALLIAVMPANIYMVTDHNRFGAIPLWALWLRLPMQLPLIWWCWLYTRL